MFFTLRTSALNFPVHRLYHPHSVFSSGLTILGISARRESKYLICKMDMVLFQLAYLGISGVEMEERKWEDLEFDCLVNVLGRVDMESLLLYVPFVCKSWYKASLNPSCWKHLVFPTDVDPEWDLTLIEKIQDGFSEEVLKYIADECPALISLSLPVDHFLNQ
ncbi:hypothetical protein OIU74_002742 [Salix koriyanagi]|uniref:F-box domain-containing protein n=1 Tax=Salix koriyanagi TaxID=2511006 RepID=A0A9Q0X4V1_9ROSI|nr:hypothetical protein OIU74_002742 [Salix koriyanagi]